MAAQQRYTTPYRQTPATGDIPPLDGLRLLGDVQRLVVQPGDVLVVSCTYALSLTQSHRLRQALDHFFPGHEALILDAGLQLDVVAPTEEPV